MEKKFEFNGSILPRNFGALVNRDSYSCYLLDSEIDMMMCSYTSHTINPSYNGAKKFVNDRIDNVRRYLEDDAHVVVYNKDYNRIVNNLSIWVKTGYEYEEALRSVEYVLLFGGSTLRGMKNGYYGKYAAHIVKNHPEWGEKDIQEFLDTIIDEEEERRLRLLTDFNTYIEVNRTNIENEITTQFEKWVVVRKDWKKKREDWESKKLAEAEKFSQYKLM